MTDVALVNGDLQAQNRWITGHEKIIQSVSIRLGRFRGEWFLDPSSGLPWMEWLGVRNTSLADIVARISSEILRVDGITQIQTITPVKDESGAVTISAQILLDPEITDQPVLGISVSGTGRVTVL